MIPAGRLSTPHASRCRTTRRHASSDAPGGASTAHARRNDTRENASRRQAAADRERPPASGFSSHARHDVASRGIQQLLTPHPPGREPTSIRRRYRRTIASGGPARARAADAERPRVPCLRERSRELCDEHAHERGSARERHATCSMRVAYGTSAQRREAGAASTGGVAAACRRAARRT